MPAAWQMVRTSTRSGSHSPLLQCLIKQSSISYNTEMISPAETGEDARSFNFFGYKNGTCWGRLSDDELNNLSLPPFCYLLKTSYRACLLEGNLRENLVCPSICTDRDMVAFSDMCWSLRLCSTLWDPIDCNLPGLFVHRISQARIMEWVAIPFSRGSSQPKDQTQDSCIGRHILYHLSHQGSL